MNNKTINWIEIIKDWKTSGKTQAEYCREKELSASAFGYHFRKKSSENPKKSFIEIPIKSQEIGNILSLEVNSNGEVVIWIKPGGRYAIR